MEFSDELTIEKIADALIARGLVLPEHKTFFVERLDSRLRKLTEELADRMSEASASMVGSLWGVEKGN